MTGSPNPNLTARDALTKAAEALEVISNGDVDVSDTAIIVGNGASTVILQLLDAKQSVEAALSTLVGAKTYEMGVEDALVPFFADREAYVSTIRPRSNQHANGIIETLALLRCYLRTLTPTNTGGTHEG